MLPEGVHADELVIMWIAGRAAYLLKQRIEQHGMRQIVTDAQMILDQLLTGHIIGDEGVLSITLTLSYMRVSSSLCCHPEPESAVEFRSVYDLCVRSICSTGPCFEALSSVCLSSVFLFCYPATIHANAGFLID